MSQNHILVGLTILAISWDEASITFHTAEKGSITAHAYGDCCSYSWVESVEEPARGYPAKVFGVREVELPWPAVNRECDVLKDYGLRITTDNGDIDIDYRNDSNGYYGGWLEFPMEGW